MEIQPFSRNKNRSDAMHRTITNLLFGFFVEITSERIERHDTGDGKSDSTYHQKDIDITETVQFLLLHEETIDQLIGKKKHTEDHSEISEIIKLDLRNHAENTETVFDDKIDGHQLLRRWNVLDVLLLHAFRNKRSNDIGLERGIKGIEKDNEEDDAENDARNHISSIVGDGVDASFRSEGCGKSGSGVIVEGLCEDHDTADERSKKSDSPTENRGSDRSPCLLFEERLPEQGGKTAASESDHIIKKKRQTDGKDIRSPGSDTVDEEVDDRIGDGNHRAIDRTAV
mgnify:CR=1 FL=1